MGLHEIMGPWSPREGHEVPQFVPSVLLHEGRRCYGIELVRISDVAFHYDEVLKPTRPFGEAEHAAPTVPAETIGSNDGSTGGSPV
jgi:hypothetical protein